MDALIIFARNAAQGRVKTRLAKTVGDDMARSIYLRLVDHTRDVASTLLCQRFVFLDGDSDAPSTWDDDHFEKHAQEGIDLGERMANAFEVAFAQGCWRVVIVGSDIPDLTSAIIQGAFAQLESADLVIGPANDGGYYLLGMKALERSVFNEIPWSTPDVMAVTLARARDSGLSVAVIEQLTDLDTIEDFASIRRRELL